MEKESFSIDDILSEVKQRKEGNNPPERDEAATTAFRLDGEDEPKPEPKADEMEPHLIINDGTVDEPEEEIIEAVEETIVVDKAAYEEPEAVAEPEAVIEPEDVVKDNQADDGMVDLFALADEPDPIPEAVAAVPEKKAGFKAFLKTKKGKAVKAVIIVLIVLIIGAVILGICFANGLLNKIVGNEGDPYEKTIYYDGMDFLQEDFAAINEVSANELYSYKEYLKWWYKNGDPVSSTHVLNVLLIGEDTRGEEISDSSRADAAIIASVNIDTGEIYFTSVLRDLFVYFETEYGNESTGQYGKINASASLGGMKCYINTLERYYKVSIDNYAVVNFASFPKIIDSLDGVTIDITSREINEINKHPKTYGGITIDQTFEGDKGKMTLNGKQALAFCRIRHIDSDGKRADRQKIVLQAIMKKMRSAGTLDTVKVVNNLAGYVYTGYDKKELIAIGNTALRDGWLGYETKSVNLPTPENAAGGQKFSIAPGNWIWLSDIPQDAHDLQMQIYGKTNIELNENRADYIAMGR